MKYFYMTITASICFLISSNGFALESTAQSQKADIQTAASLTREQREQHRQLFLQRQKQIIEERKKVLRAQHAEKFPAK